MNIINGDFFILVSFFQPGKGLALLLYSDDGDGGGGGGDIVNNLEILTDTQTTDRDLSRYLSSQSDPSILILNLQDHCWL